MRRIDFDTFAKKVGFEILGILIGSAAMTSISLAIMKAGGMFDKEIVIERQIDVQTIEVMTPVYVEVETQNEMPIPTDIYTTYGYSKSDIDLIARVVMSESSILDLDAKQAVAETILNRVESDEFPNTVAGVVYQENAYSTQDNGEVSYDCYLATESAIKFRAFPKDMYYFRTDHFHNFGTPCVCIDGMYFSTK